MSMISKNRAILQFRIVNYFLRTFGPSTSIFMLRIVPLYFLCLYRQTRQRYSLHGSASSAVLMILFAYSLVGLEGLLGTGWLDGLKAAAVAVVALAVLGMARSLLPTVPALALPWRPRSWPWRFPRPGAKSAPLRWVARSASRSCATARRAIPLRCRSPSRAPLRWPRSSPSLPC